MSGSTLIEVFGDIVFRFTRSVTEHYNPQEPVIEVLLTALRHQTFKLIASQHFQFRIVSLAKLTETYSGKLNHTPQDKAI